MYKILVVDDEDNIREVPKEYAEFEGHEVDEAVDGMQAIEMAKAKDYDIIIMDPPSFGRGNKNEVWNIEDDLDALIKDTSELLSNEAMLSKTVLENLLYLYVDKKYKGKVSSDELGLPMVNSKLILPCGITAAWER